MTRAAFYLACGSGVSALISIAACQSLLAAALAALLLARVKLEVPRIVVPLSVFILLTLIALALSDDPRAGLPQVKKFYVYLMLPVIYTAIRHVADIRRLIWWWAAAASASALWSFVQFGVKWQQTLAQHGDFYLAYVADRVTGFMGHWMTFGAAQMAALLLLVTMLIHSPPRRYRPLAYGAVALIAASLVIGWTRSVWLAVALALTYVVSVSRPRYLLLAPPLLLIGWFAAPQLVRERVISIYRPHGTVDSNQHRYITSRAGLEMIKAHPWFGIGPDVPKKEFDRYLPADIKRPLPAGFYGHLHNVYLQFAAERGVPALLVFLWMLAMMIHDWWTRARVAVFERRGILHGCIAVMFALLVEAFFEHNLGDSEVLSIFWIVAAWGYRAWRVEA